MKTMGKEAVMINKEMIDLRYVEQIVDSEQVTALGYCMRYAQKHLMNGKKDLRQVIAEMEKGKIWIAFKEGTKSFQARALAGSGMLKLH